MENLFVPRNLAWQLQLQHERGFEPFNEDCIAFWNHYKEVHLNNTYDEYHHHLKAPTYEQVLEWFLEKHDLDIDTHYNSNLTKKHQFQIHYKGSFCVVDCKEEFNSKKEMYHKAIEEAIKLIQG